jgi:DNA modification methylase
LFDLRREILHGDVLEQLKTLPAESVDMCMTSPPYWALRDYGIEGQLGLEPTFTEYINKLVSVFDEVKRVLKKEGTCWVNLGDTFSSSTKQTGRNDAESELRQGRRESGIKTQIKNGSDTPDKCLLMIPERFAIEMINRGWILRSKIVWHKPNAMPSSAKDRFTVDWEYLFMFAKQQKYYFETQYQEYKTSIDKMISKTEYFVNGNKHSKGLHRTTCGI